MATGTPPVSRTTFRCGDKTDSMSVKPSHGVNAFYAPSRRRLRSALEAAAAGAGVERHHRTIVTDVIMRRDRVVGVEATTPDGRTIELEARLVIGADGTDSTIARHVAAPPTRLAARPTATTYAYWSGLVADGYEWAFTPDARTGVIPTDGGLTCVFTSASPERIGLGGASLIRDAVAATAPELADQLRAPAAREGRTTRPRTGFVRRSHGPGWALVGTAGYAKDPLGVHGFTDALRDAELLARAVLAGHEAGAMDDALEHYEAVRDRVGAPVFDVVDRLGAADGAEVAHLLLQLSSAMADEVEAIAALDAEHVP